MLDSNRASSDAQTDDMNQAAAIAVLSKGFTVANFLVTIILVVGMIIDTKSVTVSVLSGVAYFAVSTTIIVSVLSGTVKAIWVNGQNQQTLRQRDILAYQSQLGADAPQRAQRLRVLPTAPLQLPAPAEEMPTNYVPAISDTMRGARKEAIGWVLPLYGDDGMPDAAKVNLSDKKEKPGRLWAPKPSEEALKYLQGKGIVHDLGNGLRLNLTHCPTVDDVRERLR